jgi:replicative DNA helicase
LIVIDYLQLLRGSSRRSQDNRQLEISEISAGIKALAKELHIPIIVIAQLNWQPELRGKVTCGVRFDRTGR